MIFVILGTQRFQLNRLIEELDRLIENGELPTNEIIIQHGYSKKSRYAKNFKLISEENFINYIKESDLVITHGGTSAIINALKLSKKVIVIPRKSEYGEHVDNHQQEIVDLFFYKGYIEKVDEIRELLNTINKAADKEYVKYVPTNNLAEYLVDKFINNIQLGRGRKR